MELRNVLKRDKINEPGTIITNSKDIDIHRNNVTMTKKMLQCKLKCKEVVKPNWASKVQKIHLRLEKPSKIRLK